MGKGEIAHYERFLLFLQCFQKACFLGASKRVIVWEWVKLYTNLQTHDCCYMSASFTCKFSKLPATNIFAGLWWNYVTFSTLMGDNDVFEGQRTRRQFGTHYHKTPHFDAVKIYSCGKHCE